MKSVPMIPQDSGPAPEATYETTGLVADPAKTGELRESIQRALKTVFDPEIPVDIWELGLIYDVFVTADGVAAIRMTLTAPGCPAAQVLPSQVADAASRGRRDRREGRCRLGAWLDQGSNVGRREAAARHVVKPPRDCMLRLSKKADYALMAMKHLAIKSDAPSISARESLSSTTSRSS